MSKTSLVRQNFHEEAEAALNVQVVNEYYAGYVYKSMSMYFARDDIALLGFYKFYKNLSVRYFERAKKWQCYQDQRGGRVVYKDIPKPESDTWGTPLECMEKSLKMEKTVQQALLDIYNVADKHNDAHLSHFVKDEFLDESVPRVKKIGDYVTQLQRLTSADHKGLGEWMFDQKLVKAE